jgi:hypothetical protein
MWKVEAEIQTEAVGVEGRNQGVAGQSQDIQEIPTAKVAQKLLNVGIVARRVTTKINVKLQRRRMRATLQMWWQMERP